MIKETNINTFYLHFFLIFISILFISNTSPISFEEGYKITILIVLLIIILRRRIKPDPIILYLSLAWFITNIVSFLYNRTIFPVATIFGYLISLYIPYLVIKIYGNQFWIKLEKVFFYLTVIALPIFLLNVLIPSFFSSLDVIFGSWAADIYKLKDSQAHFWYSFVYTFSGKTDATELRNSGFMWEPGAFAMILSYAILFNWYRNNFKIDAKIIVYFIALISTLSTMGFISMFLLILIYLINKKSILLKIGIIVSLLYALPFILDQNFILPKIQQFIIESSKDKAFKQETTGNYEMNRISTMLFSLEKSTRLPTGFGVIPDKMNYNKISQYLVGVNGLGGILVFWGWTGIIFLIYSLKRFAVTIFSKTINPISVILTILVILVTFFSNPIERNFFMFALVLTPYIEDFKEIKISDRIE